MKPMKSSRKRVSIRTETNVLIKSRRRCALCAHLHGDVSLKEGQVAHLDRNRANDAEDNLAFLCLQHHSLYDSQTSQHKGFTIGEAKAARKELEAWARRTGLQVTGRQIKEYALPPLQVNLSGFARSVRSEGYSELVGEIHLALSGRIGSPSKQHAFAEINVQISTNITNRIDRAGMTDIALISSAGKIIGRARIGTQPNPGQFNNVTFEAVPIKPSKGLMNEWFSIVGIRVNAVATGMSNRMTGRALIKASVEVYLYPGGKILLAGEVPVAVVRHPTQFSLTATPTSVELKETRGIREPPYIQSFEISCLGSFYESFKTRTTEAYEPEYASAGTLLALNLSSVPTGFEVFVTARDLPSLNQEAKARPLAVAVRTDPNGYRLSVRSDASLLLWNCSIPMVKVENNLACWEFVLTPPPGRPPLVQFGLSMIAPHGFRPDRTMQAALGFAPFYTTAAAGQPSGTLAIPRFTPGTVPVDLLPI